MAQQELFPGERIDKHPACHIPEMLGRVAGQFLNTTRWVDVMFETGKTSIYIPDGKDAELTASGYASGTNFEGDFTHWKTEQSGSIVEVSGYLAGFPRLQDSKQTVDDCLHIWTNNSDVLVDTYAFSLRSIAGLAVYSKFRTNLEIDLDEMGMGESSGYQIPLLKCKSTGETFYRDATYEDITQTIKTEASTPVLVFGKTTATSYTIVNQDSVKHLLD